MSWKNTAFIAILAFAQPAAAVPEDVIPPPVPANLAVNAGETAFLIAHATGTQNYICLPGAATPTGIAWTLFGPQATLFNDAQEQVATHYLSPNPDESGTPRATWQHSLDTSAVWARAVETSLDPNFVAPAAIPWLLLRVVGDEAGPTFGGSFTGTTAIQRVNTVGGVAPATGCRLPKDVGKRALIPYTTDYVFYR